MKSALFSAQDDLILIRYKLERFLISSLLVRSLSLIWEVQIFPDLGSRNFPVF